MKTPEITLPFAAAAQAAGTDRTERLTVLGWRVGPLDNNTYVIADPQAAECVIVDPSFDSRFILDEVEARGWRITRVLNTHAHIDHVVENALFVERSGAPLGLHPGERDLLEMMDTQAAWLGVETPRRAIPTHWLEDGEIIEIGHGAISVALTPGHSPASVSFVGDGFVIAGDALFAGSIGRTDLPGGSHARLIESIRTRLMSLPDETVVCPGHGPYTTIGLERESNPFLAGGL